jgi:hypothetical protein
VAIASLLGSHFAGSIVMAINYRRMGQSAKAWCALLLGLVTAVGLLTVAVLLPDSLSTATRGVAIGIVVGMFYLAKQLQSRQYEEFLAAGGRKASAWAAAGIGLACLAVVMGGLLAYGYTSTTLTLGTPVQVPGGGQIHCGQGATKEEALRIAAVLGKEELDLAECTVQFSREGGRPVLAIVVAKDAWKDPFTLLSFRALAQTLSEQALNKGPVDVILWDDELEVRERLTWEPPPGVQVKPPASPTKRKGAGPKR